MNTSSISSPRDILLLCEKYSIPYNEIPTSVCHEFSTSQCIDYFIEETVFLVYLETQQNTENAVTVSQMFLSLLQKKKDDIILQQYIHRVLYVTPYEFLPIQRDEHIYLAYHYNRYTYKLLYGSLFLPIEHIRTSHVPFSDFQQLLHQVIDNIPSFDESKKRVRGEDGEIHTHIYKR